MWVPGMLMALGTAWVGEDEGCPAYKCAPASVPFNSTTCVYYEDEVSTFYTAACTDHYSKYCPPLTWEGPSNATNSTCELPPPPPLVLSWPGERCLNDTFCAVGNCESNLCYGEAVGQSCSSNNVCSPGLVCNLTSGLTQFALAPGQGTCTSDYDCVNFAGCVAGTCVRYMTVEAGGKVDGCAEDGTNYLCQNLGCATMKTGSFCTEPVTSLIPSTSAAPTPCLPNNATYCLSHIDTSTTAQFSGRCLCSYSPAGKGYCAAFPGDPIGLSYLGYLKQWFNSTAILQCNTERRLSPLCMQTHWDPELTNNLTYAALTYQYFPSMAGMDNCTKAIYLQDFFQAQELVLNPQTNGAGRVAWGLGVVLGLIVSA